MGNYELDLLLSQNKRPLAEPALPSVEAVQNDGELRNFEFALWGDGLIQKAIGRCRSGGGFEWKHRERLQLVLRHSFPVDSGFYSTYPPDGKGSRVFALSF